MQKDEISALLKKNSQKLMYIDFAKIILDFQLEEHEKFLEKFTNIYR